MSIFDVLADNLVPITLSLVAVAVAYKFFAANAASGKKPAAAAAAAPARADALTRFAVGRAGDLADGAMAEVKLADDCGTILLMREGGSYFATGSKCTHSSAPLAKGVFMNGRIRCPWHGACFDTKTGDIEEMPGVDSLQSFPVTVEPDGTLSIAASKIALKENWRRQPSVCHRNENRDKRVFVILGSGAAGFTCAETLRKEGFEGRVVLIGQEPHLPYDRTKLSKTMSLAVDKMYLRQPSFFAEANIDTRLGVEGVDIDVKKKAVALSDGTSVSYDCLFVATGAVPRTLSCPGVTLAGIHCLRVPEEAATILKHANKDTKLVIVGSSFIGMETAAVLFDKVASVDVIGMEKTPFERVLGPEIGAGKIVSLFFRF
jgi:nitrite reductase/ring-hydroxylating ferredoxin subunit